MKTLLGYADRISARPGDAVAFKVGSLDSAPYDAVIVRLINGDTNPAGPGYAEIEVEGSASRQRGRPQAVRAGSCAIVPGVAERLDGTGFGIELLMWPTMPDKAEQVLASLWDEATGSGFVLSLLAPGGLSLRLGDDTGGKAVVTLGAPVRERCWYRVSARFTAATGMVTLRQDRLQAPGIGSETAETTRVVALGPFGRPAAPLLLAARASAASAGYQGFYNGKLEAPRLTDAAGDAVGAWDFGIGIDCERIEDVSGNALHGSTWQMPARGMTGHGWDGSEQSWRHAPSQYGAIHFHDDDIADAGWDTDFTWTVPDGLPSGLYAARLNGGQDEDYIPFVVRPGPHEAPRDRLLFIVPTASYQAYANEHLALDASLAELVHDHLPVLGPSDVFLAEHRELGGSLYDRHSDGSGISTSSRLRPILNMRPKYQSWLGGTGSALWQLGADTHLLAWLHRAGIGCDCITDEDLDAEGSAALAGYRCVMTGTHAEYWSTAMRDALDGHVAAGGRIMHMGGNGLYWRIAYHPERSGAIEVRRCEVGNGWITAPGESYHAFTGEYGGLWRRIGRPPQQTVGVGFAGQGFDRSGYYRRLPASRDPRARFIFEGVEDDIIGDFGLIGGGAAGIELDRTDPSLGTPPHTLVLARSENHTASTLPTLEGLLINYVNQAEVSPVWAELAFFETVSGGAVFSTGSIAWAGSLSHDGYRNSVARISANVVARFLDATTFHLPARETA